MIYLDDFDFKDKKALVRVDFNVPLDSNLEITDDTRIKAVVPTIEKILDDGGSVILMSHLGRPKGGFEEKYSLKHLVGDLSSRFMKTIEFAEDCIGEDAINKAFRLQPGDILLLENLRFHVEEKQGAPEFAKKLSILGNVYVNDAFGTAHRAHASTAVIAQFFSDKVAGYVMQSELNNANNVLQNAQKPFTAIMGGAKISEKILIIEQLLDKIDNLIVGGAMTYTFFKAFAEKA